ncbi:PLP-dependent transferase [Violaceomyces palustris]|uniref:PLP-dependent transferase n=1 Tax=Violaceomyces palustris TaxID=1673888 RepID=A0ACD0NPY6_9BASI|nr:PLP-dependent transferase [Violaceomyces palustris]
MACAPACFPAPGPLCVSPFIATDPVWQEKAQASVQLPNGEAAKELVREEESRDFSHLGSPPKLSRRGQDHASKITPFWNTFDCMLNDGFHPDANEGGIVNMGIANNSLMEDELLEYMHNNFKIEAIDLTYGSSLFGSTRLFQALCTHYNSADFSPKVPVLPKHILTSPGCGPLLDQIFEHLADPGDGVLVAAPCYNGFEADLTTRSKVHCIPVHCPKDKGHGSEAFNFEGESALRGFEEAIKDSESKGIKITSIIVCNPNNPVGRCYDRGALLAYGRFAAKHGLHLVFDEIYALSTFPTKDVDKPQPFISALNIDWADESGLHPGYVHILSSASKDFGLNGFRVGTFVSQHNETLVGAMKMTCKLYMVSSPADALFSSLLLNQDYLQGFIKTNRLRLAEAYDFVRSWCLHHKIDYTPSNAGHFLLVDLSRFMPREIQGRELEGREAESALWAKALDEKVCITPGFNYHHPEAGTYRLTFSLKRPCLIEGLARLEKALGLPPWL